MARKRKVGRPKMAKNTQKRGFPLRLRPVLINAIRERADVIGEKPGPMVEKQLHHWYSDLMP